MQLEINEWSDKDSQESLSLYVPTGEKVEQEKNFPAV